VIYSTGANPESSLSSRDETTEIESDTVWMTWWWRPTSRWDTPPSHHFYAVTQRRAQPKVSGPPGPIKASHPKHVKYTTIHLAMEAWRRRGWLNADGSKQTDRRPNAITPPGIHMFGWWSTGDNHKRRDGLATHLQERWRKNPLDHSCEKEATGRQPVELLSGGWLQTPNTALTENNALYIFLYHLHATHVLIEYDLFCFWWWIFW